MTDFGRVQPHAASHQSGGSDEIDLTGLSGIPNVVDRGDPASPDFNIFSFTADENWHDLDLSSIVPAGATWVLLRLLLLTNAQNGIMYLKKGGNTSEYSGAGYGTPYSAYEVYGDLWLQVGSTRVIEYWLSSGDWLAIGLTVKGWYL